MSDVQQQSCSAACPVVIWAQWAVTIEFMGMFLFMAISKTYDFNHLTLSCDIFEGLVVQRSGLSFIITIDPSYEFQ